MVILCDFEDYLDPTFNYRRYVFAFDGKIYYDNWLWGWCILLRDIEWRYLGDIELDASLAFGHFRRDLPDRVFAMEI